MHVSTDAELRIRILGRMVAPIQEIVDDLDPLAADPVAHGLAEVLAADLERHLTDLTESPISVLVDLEVLGIEEALDAVRLRLAAVSVDASRSVTGPLPTHP